MNNGTLKSVSRSFYLSLWVVPKEMRPVVGVGYLLCRAADSIADALALPHPERLSLLRKFKAVFSGFPLPPAPLKEFLSELAASHIGPATAEGKLLRNFPETAASFNQLSRTDQSLVQEVVRAVIQGMEKDLTTFGESAETLQGLATTDDLERYIGLIGGEPGRFWTKACLEHAPNLAIADRGRWLTDGIRFGTGLQMINILRDLPKDLTEGRCYIPKELLADHGLKPADLFEPKSNDRFLGLYHALIDETVGRLRHGLAYIAQIPAGQVRLRAAVWWPLIIGARTLEELRKAPNILGGTLAIKIKRWEVYRLVGSSLPVLPVNRFLNSRFEAVAEAASSSSGFNRA